MRTEKTIGLYLCRCSYTLDRGEGSQEIIEGGFVGSGMVQAAPGACLPVRDNTGHGRRIKEVEARDLRYGDRQQVYGLVAFYFENSEG